MQEGEKFILVYSDRKYSLFSKSSLPIRERWRGIAKIDRCQSVKVIIQQQADFGMMPGQPSRRIERCLLTDSAFRRSLPRRTELRSWVNFHKFIGCVKCGESALCCLAYHHRDPRQKVASISHLVKNLMPKAMILAEMDKCDLLCANCHSKAHAGKEWGP